ncbi:MAG TPA: MEDS domain-containing protein [Solirubrobacteraceae bacterium]|jgi:hypothetical protein|nr:MEDS domain-containing protein [Solirubrobacteraceae bacterium]
MADLETIQCEHAVLFYESDAELTDAVVPYLDAGARANEALVVIADHSHRRAFEARLELPYKERTRSQWYTTPR